MASATTTIATSMMTGTESRCSVTAAAANAMHAAASATDHHARSAKAARSV
jgi:hypothetical protein